MTVFQVTYRGTEAVEAETESEALEKFHQQHSTAIALSVEDSAVIGRCEGCSRYILEDMQHIVFIDGEMLCVGCFIENADEVPHA